MRFMGVICFLFGYVICAEYDLFFKAVPNTFTLFLAFSGLMLAGLNGISVGKIIFSVIALIVFALLSGRMLKFIGGADLKIIVVTYMTVGLLSTVRVLAVAFITAGIFSVFFLISNKVKPQKRKAETVPFVPFLLLGVITLFV